MDIWTIDKVIEKFNLNEDFIFFDIGTHTGQELEKILPFGVEVHAFDPHPQVAAYVKAKYGMYDNLIFNESAVWEKDEIRDFYFCREPDPNWDLDPNSTNVPDCGSSLLKEKTNLSGSGHSHSATERKYVSVNCIDISEYIFGLGKQIDIMKLDAEGAEYYIMKHLIETNAIGKIDNLFFEDHSHRFPNDFSEYYQNKEFVEQKINELKINIGMWP